MEIQKPKVGLGVMVLKEGKVLLGKRKGAHGDGEYAWPGGHLEYMESFEDCVKRETREEAGIEIENVRFLLLRNMREYAPKHYVDIVLLADWKSGEPIVLEPESCESWGWYDLKELPSPLFGSELIALDAYKNNYCYLDG